MKRCFLFPALFIPFLSHAQPIPPQITITLGNGTPQTIAPVLKIILLLTILSLAPAILVMFTSFTRIVVVLSFIRQALGTQQMPPSQVLVGLSLFLTFFIMAPVYNEVNLRAIKPYMKGKIALDDALKEAEIPIKKFMLKQTRKKDLELFYTISGEKRKFKNYTDLPLRIVLPSFIISELKTAFQIGFLIYIPFLVIDMIVASVLLSMGMMMLPPVMVSLPFKIVLFVLADGWYLVVGSLVKSFF